MQRFRKICSFVLFFFILFVNGNSFSEVVKKLEIKGNLRISQETIIVFGDISLGKDYSISDVNSLIKKLYEDYSIKCAVQYYPLYKYSLFKKMGFSKGKCPNTEKFYNNMISWSSNNINVILLKFSKF